MHVDVSIVANDFFRYKNNLKQFQNFQRRIRNAEFILEDGEIHLR